MIEPGTGSIALKGLEASAKLYQRGSLIATTWMLAQRWGATTDEAERSFYAIAATVCAHAAADAILNEWAEQRRPDLYRRHARGSLTERADVLLPLIGGTVPPDLAPMSEAKNSLGHAMPDHERSLRIGAWVAGEGAKRSLSVVESLESQFFPRGQPA